MTSNRSRVNESRTLYAMSHEFFMSHALYVCVERNVREPVLHINELRTVDVIESRTLHKPRTLSKNKVPPPNRDPSAVKCHQWF